MGNAAPAHKKAPRLGGETRGRRAPWEKVWTGGSRPRKLPGGMFRELGAARTVSPTIVFGGPRRGQRWASRPAASTCQTLSSRAGGTCRQGWLSCGSSRKRRDDRAALVAREKPEPPMTLANMRRNGVRAVIATCQSCGGFTEVNGDTLPETIGSPKRAEATDAATAEGTGSMRDRPGTQGD
jgi:hypothetical protein